MWRLFIGGAPPQVRPIDLLLVTLGLIKVDFKEDFLDCRGAFEDGALGTDMALVAVTWSSNRFIDTFCSLLQTE